MLFQPHSAINPLWLNSLFLHRRGRPAASVRALLAPRGKKDAATKGAYYKGMAVFTVVKGGAMYEAALGGEKFSYSPKGSSDDH